MISVATMTPINAFVILVKSTITVAVKVTNFVTVYVVSYDGSFSNVIPSTLPLLVGPLPFRYTGLVGIFTARCYAERSIAMASRLSVRP